MTKKIIYRDLRKCKYENCEVDISHRHKTAQFCSEECKLYNRGDKPVAIKKPKIKKIPVLPYVYKSKCYDK
jgi:hypothetical protein